MKTRSLETQLKVLILGIGNTIRDTLAHSKMEFFRVLANHNPIERKEH